MNYEDLYLQYQLLNYLQVNFQNQLTKLQIQTQIQIQKQENKLNNTIISFETKLNKFEKYINEIKYELNKLKNNYNNNMNYLYNNPQCKNKD